MLVTDFLTPECSLLLRSRSKRAALRVLVNAVCRQHPALSADEVLERIEAREREISTLIAPGIALPHARLVELQEPVVAVGLHTAGVPWQSGPPERANLILLVLGSEQDPGQHIHLLAEIARALENEARLKALLSARTPRALFEAFAEPEPVVHRERVTRKDRVPQGLLAHAAELARDIARSSVMIHDDGDLNPEWLKVFPEELPLILSARDTGKYLGCVSPFRTLLQVPSKGLVPKYRVELAIMLAISQGLLERDRIVVNVYGAGGLGGLDTLSVVDVGKTFANAPYLGNEVSGEDIEYQVLSHVLNIALSLAAEGREGKPVGTIFVLGDSDGVAQRSSQIVINPFKGYAEDERNVLDPSLEETIKEFAAIDGAFLIRGDGVIMAAGACLHTDPESATLPSGLGTRHVAAMSITAHTKALSIVISQSTGAVRIFKNGKEVLVLEKPGR
ncbi:MAG TPA: PTS sugar transporter subunit IIA [Candidatus Hydrogenedentes bacterium]|jgi:mannitol/fructose-specific phosphotransferase system IIA component (Ntr-type)|nr:PTS sugar transporter subunit IIA [Candidatus Hydrogenedentota bacterium]NLT60335.1 PTS transporter subunit EIIA [Candidatus Hydrogenedentota bacterium]HNV22059.1 PTS sugar transporter subunit IIA [Candidatus Hydrogenedentota bacterium]HNZ17663.1 PTS sugar transporter subunit IIA [Candidatus Hydrogenedentota bacterium]HOH35095.1 PTS sugar transporter subunit IIA [Candidatus Hydrogenedentota bacterium]